VEKMAKKEYDFSNKDPSAVLTEDELENFDEGMELKNESGPASEVDFGKAVRSVSSELNVLFS
jgi:hypothetical protein